MEIDPNIVLIVVITTISSMYGMGKMLQFKVSENRKQREHLQKQRKTKMDYELKMVKEQKSPNLSKLAKNIDINGILEGIEDEEDIDDLPLPSWLKPLAKGFMKKFMAGKDEDEEEDEHPKQT